MRLASWLSAAVLVVACSAATSADASMSKPQRCPNPHGGQCVGLLAPDRMYTSTMFRPPVTYAVPTRGWRNFEDWPGSFGLVPAGNSVAGVDAGTSDFVGVFTSVAAARFTDLSTCAAARVRGVPKSPSGIARWITSQRALGVGGPKPAAVGGLRGLKLDVRVRSGATLPTCFAPDQNRSFTVALLLVGLPPSSVLLGVETEMTVRLYLLGFRSGTLAIALTDVDDAPGSMRSLDAVARRFTFRA